jgi:hypothetical protein
VIEMANDDIFFDKKITNKDIYQEVLNTQELCQKSINMSKKAIMISSGAITLSVVVLGFLIQHINK